MYEHMKIENQGVGRPFLGSVKMLYKDVFYFWLLIDSLLLLKKMNNVFTIYGFSGKYFFLESGIFNHDMCCLANFGLDHLV